MSYEDINSKAARLEFEVEKLERELQAAREELAALKELARACVNAEGPANCAYATIALCAALEGK